VTLRIWLHEGHDGDPGVSALGLDFLGFSTWAESDAEVVAKVPTKFEAYSAWRSRHGLPVDAGDSRVEVVDCLVGNEILFSPDLEAARPEDIDLTIRLLACSRADLTAQLEAAPKGVFDWNPHYRRFAPWADWRTIRANLAHIANGETHYYTKNIGHTPSGPPADSGGDWKVLLSESRRETVAFLEDLKSSQDLLRVRTVDHGFGEESSIARIIREYRALQSGS
jgi:hypothetical protein